MADKFYEGSTEDEAVARASEALSIDPADLEYTVEDKGSDGVFGVGARPLKIRVRVDGEAPAEAESDSDSDSGRDEEAGADDAPRRKTGPAPEKAAEAKKVTEELLGFMGVKAQIEVRDEEENIVVIVSEDGEATDVADVLGKGRPSPLPSIQFLLNKIVNRFPEERKHIAFEAPSVPKRKDRAAPEPAKEPESMPEFEDLDAELEPELDRDLIRLGLDLGKRAIEVNRVLSIHPMTSIDRRAVHQTITRIPGVSSVSEGDGLYRKLHIIPASLGEAPSGGNRKRRRGRRRPRAEG